MKKYIPFYFIILLTLGIQFTSFMPNDAAVALDNIKASQLEDLETLEHSIATFVSIASSYGESEEEIAQLQKAHLNNRLNFKFLEGLLHYYNDGAIVKHLNGAPLPKPEPAVAENSIIEPTGLQVLDELVFSGDPHAEKEEIIRLAVRLENRFKSIKAFQIKVNMTHRHIFEAARQELVRIFTLGVTGFDTPGSANAIPEAVNAMKGVEKLMKAYYPLIQKQDAETVEKLEDLFTSSLAYLKANNDFENFDRLTFLKDFINPLYALIYEAHRGTGIETVEEVDPLPQPFNYHATNIFSNDFLNSSYYANMDFDNPEQEKRVSLGKFLFFDPILSSSNDLSCATCHQPSKAFTDGLTKSKAKNGGTVQRNAPTVINAVFAEKYFYDLRQKDLKKQTKHVIFDSREFDTDFQEITTKLNKSKEYKQLFSNAYSSTGVNPISAATITNALASYVATLYSFNSPVDKYIRGESDELSESAKNGFNLFMGKAACGTCHFAPTFNGSVPPFYKESESEVLGVPATNDTINVEIDPDLGRVANELLRDDVYFYQYSFKTVTVRNAALTAPYMHNGVYNTLEEVVDFYNRGGGAGMGIEGIDHQTLPFDNLSLTKKEQADIVAFMEALTDNPFENDAPESLPTFEGKPEWDKRYQKGVY